VTIAWWSSEVDKKIGGVASNKTERAIGEGRRGAGPTMTTLFKCLIV
jgi:hypothetical protein